MAKSIIKNTIYKFALSVFNIIVPIIVAPYINGLLDKPEYNIYNKGLSMLMLFMIFATYGIYNFGVREISKVRNDKKKLSALFTNLFMFGAITSLVTSAVYIGYVLLAVQKGEQLIFLILVIQLVSNTFMVEWVNEAVESYGFITVKTVIIRIVNTVLIFLAVTDPHHVVRYALLMSLCQTANNLASFIHVKKHIAFDFSSIKLAQYIKPLTLLVIITNVGVLYSTLDRVLLAQFASDTAVSEYVIPSNLINMVVTVMTSLITVALPRLNYYVSIGDKKGYLDLLDKSSRSYLMLIFPSCVGLFCLGYEVMYLYGSTKWVDAYPVLQMLALRFIFMSYYTIMSNQIMYVHKQEKALVKILLIGGVMNVIFKAVLIGVGQLTPVSVIITTAIAEVVMIQILQWYIRHKMKLDINMYSLRNMRYFYCSLPFVPIVYGVKALSLGIIPTCLIAIPICCVVYFALLLIFKDDMLKYYIDKVKQKLLKKGA